MYRQPTPHRQAMGIKPSRDLGPRFQYRLARPWRGLGNDVQFVLGLALAWLTEDNIFDLRAGAWALHCRRPITTPYILKAISHRQDTLVANGELRMLKSLAAWYPKVIYAQDLYATVFGHPSRRPVLKWLLETYPINLDLHCIRKPFMSASLPMVQTVVPEYAQVSFDLLCGATHHLSMYCTGRTIRRQWIPARNVRAKCRRAASIIVWLIRHCPFLQGKSPEKFIRRTVFSVLLAETIVGQLNQPHNQNGQSVHSVVGQQQVENRPDESHLTKRQRTSPNGAAH